MTILSCNKESDVPRLSSLSVPVITGLKIRDADGYNIMNIGQPNAQEEVEKDGNTFFLVSYSAYGYYSSINVNAQCTRSIDEITVWIVKAQFDFDLLSGLNTPFDKNYLNSIAIEAGGYPIAYHTESNFQKDYFSYRFDRELFNIGVYRIYAKIDGVLLWSDILYSTHNQ